ncbi:MAG: NUDIX domain-containing protein, partial [Gammaproteobacteria bacterium]|nr:NUDIX domain-containing protein [Gammaproteobacteria bacterium]
QAVLRETQEELGLSGEIQAYIGHYTFVEKNQLILCFEINATGELKLNDELVEMKYLSQQELQEYDFQPLYITENIIKDWAEV